MRSEAIADDDGRLLADDAGRSPFGAPECGACAGVTTPGCLLVGAHCDLKVVMDCRCDDGWMMYVYVSV